MKCKFTFSSITVWPGKKNRSHKISPFKATYQDTLELLDKELRMLRVRQAFIQIDLPASKFRLDGLPYADARPASPGAILCFHCRFGDLKYATDVFSDWHCNLRAIALGLEALRKVDRYGITKRGEQYTGFKQLAASAGPARTSQTAAEFIAKYSDFTADQLMADHCPICTAYRQAAIKLHPDKGGDEKLFCTLQECKSILESR